MTVAASMLAALALAAAAQEPETPPITCLGACAVETMPHSEDLTVFEAVSRAKCEEGAELADVVMLRFAAGELLVMRVDVRRMMATGVMKTNFVLRPGDILYLPRRAELKRRNAIDCALLAVAAAKHDRGRMAQILGYRLVHTAVVEAQQQLAMQLGQIGAEAAPAVPQLLAALAFDALAAREAATALGMIGPAAKAAVPALRALATAKDVQLRARAAAALRQIEAPAKPR